MIIFGLDIETSKIPFHYPWKDGYYMTCLSISYPNNTERTWFFYHHEPNVINDPKQYSVIQSELDKADMVSAHNAKFELNCLRQHLTFHRVWCTQVAEYIIRYQSNGDLGLSEVAQHYGLPPKLDKVKTMWEAGYDTADIPTSLLQEYCQDDAKKARIIAEKQLSIVKQTGLLKCCTLQMEWLNVLSVMESTGVPWDQTQANKIITKYRKYEQIINSVIKRKIGPYVNGHDINLNSGDDLSAVLYGGKLIRRVKVPIIREKNIKVQMPYVFTYKGGEKKIKLKWNQHPNTKVIRMVYQDKLFNIPGLGITPLKKTELAKHNVERPLFQTDKLTLSALASSTPLQKAIIKLLLKQSVVIKVITSFVNDDNTKGLINKITASGRLHTNYNQTVTATGRLSSSDPNSQNLPRGNTSPIKTCIVPEFDGIMQADLSQIEWRVPAQLSGDSTMIQEVTSGIDQHGAACTSLMKLPLNYKNRYFAKIFNFRMIYGGTEYGFFKDPHMPDFKLKRWREIIQAFYIKYSGLKSWHDTNITNVVSVDGTLTLFTGRRYKFKFEGGKYNEREIKNYPVQGLAGGDILPLAGVIIYKAMCKRNYKSKIILTVHDSLVFDYVETEKENLAKLCLHVFNNLPKYIKQYWGYDWIVPLTGEIEIGPNYGQLTRYIP